MSANPTEPVERAIELLRADPKLTRYKAAQMVGVTPGALYNSVVCKRLMAERGQPKRVITNRIHAKEAAP